MSGLHRNSSITFVCGNVYPLFAESLANLIGGMETRAAMFARGLASTKRWDVNFIVDDFGQPDRTSYEGIEFYIYQPTQRRIAENVNPRFAKHKWFPILNLDRHDLELLWQAPLLALYRLLPGWLYPMFWRTRRSQMVCCFGNNAISAQVIADCCRLGIKTILCIAADSDLAPDYRPEDRSLNDYATPKWMAYYALKKADHVFVQTEHQLLALEDRFERGGELIRNPVHIATDDPVGWPSRDTRDIVLWIGRSDTFHKRPLLFLELARRCPDIPFLMIVNQTHANVFETLQAERPTNLMIIERVPHEEIWDYYRRARVFISTSAYEGFPNTFLQCAVAGVPVASLAVDPEGILSQGCGLFANGSLETLERDVRSLWFDAALAERHALTFHRFALAHHDYKRQVSRFESLLEKVIATPIRKPPPWWYQPHSRFLERTEF